MQSDKLADFAQREGRVPSGFEYAAMEREAAVDTRSRKSGLGVVQRHARHDGDDAAWLVHGHDPR
jgi:hypothetical protein